MQALVISFGVTGKFGIKLALSFCLKSLSVGSTRRSNAFNALQSLFTLALVNPSKFSPMVLTIMTLFLWSGKLQ